MNTRLIQAAREFVEVSYRAHPGELNAGSGPDAVQIRTLSFTMADYQEFQRKLRMLDAETIRCEVALNKMAEEERNG